MPRPKRPFRKCLTENCERDGNAAQGICHNCYWRKRRLERKAAKLECAVDGCTRIATDRRKMCYTCYDSFRRDIRRIKIQNGELEPRDKPKTTYYNTSGYVVGYAPDHPLAKSGGIVLEHRRIGYEKYGSGIQQCHWCTTAIEWADLHIDHLDWVRDNNHPSNLVTSCKTCNVTRTQPVEVTETESTGRNLRALSKRLNR